MPYRQAVFRQLAADDRCGGRGEKGADRPRRRYADHQADQDQQLDRHAHPVRGLVGLLGHVGRSARRTEEHVEHEAQRIRDTEHAGDRRQDGQALADPWRCVDEGDLGKEHFLRQEAVEQRDASHGCARDDRQCSGDRHQLEQAAELADVAGAGLVVDDAGRHEERRLEGRMIHDVEHGRNRRQWAVEAQQQGDEPEMRNGRIRQECLEVALEHRHIAAEQQRDHPRAAHHPEPLLRTGQHGPQPRHEEHAEFHHRGRMQVRRDGRGCRHGAWQPEMKGKLRALGEGAQQHQHERNGIEPVCADLVSRGQHGVELIAADNVPQQQHTTQQAESTRTGDGERHARAAPRIAPVVPVADQQEREETGEFPEQHHLDEVAREHHAHHRAHEREEEREEARHRVGRRHVVARIEHHQTADAQHEHGEQPRETVHAEYEIQAEYRQPLDLLPNHVAAGDSREEPGCLDCTAQGDEAG